MNNSIKIKAGEYRVGDLRVSFDRNAREWIVWDTSRDCRAGVFLTLRVALGWINAGRPSAA